MSKTLINWGWSPALITAIAVLGVVYELPIEILVPTLIVILGIGLVIVMVRARDKQLEQSVIRLRQLVSYFNRRFTGNSSLSIFAIIDGLFGTENPKLWDWARACDMSQRIFNTWCNSFISRLESDARNRSLVSYLHNYLMELWSINSHYYEFVDQFYEVAASVEIPRELTDQYNKFVIEYNIFVEDFRAYVSKLKQDTKTGIEPPSVKLARALAPLPPVDI